MKKMMALLGILLYAVCFPGMNAAHGQSCTPMTWCSEEVSAAFNNMHSGAFGQMFETQGIAPICLCGVRFLIGTGSGIIGSVSRSPGSPCRVVLYAVNPDDSVIELAHQAVDQEISGLSDFHFGQVLIGYLKSERYAVVIETEDEQWGLWQDCNASENCCPEARPVRIEAGMAIYNDPSFDDYFFELLISEDIQACQYVIPDNARTWGEVKGIYR